MATQADIAAVLADLSAAYPERPLSPDTIRVYAEHLSDIPAALLRRTVHEMIANSDSQYLPRVTQLRAEAARLAGLPGSRDFRAAPDGDDRLRARAVALENAACRDGVFDQSEWEALAVAFDQAGRTFAADDIRRRAAEYLEGA